MSKMLASVSSVTEALLALNAGVDIIDLKQPARGALGSLTTDVVRQIVSEIGGQCPISATVGDLPMQPDIVFNAVKAMAATGVNYVKIGFFPNGDSGAVIEKLAELTVRYALIAVLFADTQPDFSIIPALKRVRFKGVMLDTMDKQRGSLLEVMTLSEIAEFISLAKQQSVLCGLAGSLKIADIATLLPLQADYLGFRGALCEQQQRTGQLNPIAIAQIKQTIATV
jgi:uncharacterized protein (UPF0264 family)